MDVLNKKIIGNFSQPSWLKYIIDDSMQMVNPHAQSEVVSRLGWEALRQNSVPRAQTEDCQ